MKRFAQIFAVSLPFFYFIFTGPTGNVGFSPSFGSSLTQCNVARDNFLSLFPGSSATVCKDSGAICGLPNTPVCGN